MRCFVYSILAKRDVRDHHSESDIIQNVVWTGSAAKRATHEVLGVDERPTTKDAADAIVGTWVLSPIVWIVGVPELERPCIFSP
jgi:hypothetical protein